MVALFAVILLLTLLSVVAYSDTVNQKSVKGVRALMLIFTTTMSRKLGDFLSLSILIGVCLGVAFASIEHEHPEIVPLISLFLFFQLRLLVLVRQELKRLQSS